MDSQRNYNAEQEIEQIETELQDLKEKINRRIQTLRESVEQKYTKAQELQEESSYDGDNEMDEKWKKRTTLMTVGNRQLDRIHELCKLSDKHEFGEHKMENAELAGGP